MKRAAIFINFRISNLKNQLHVIYEVNLPYLGSHAVLSLNMALSELIFSPMYFPRPIAAHNSLFSAMLHGIPRFSVIASQRPNVLDAPPVSMIPLVAISEESAEGSLFNKCFTQEIICLITSSRDFTISLDRKSVV